MDSTSPSHRPPDFRLLLDQGFPKPPGFAVRSVDATVEVQHLHDFAPRLSEESTPDWLLYVEAARAGFDGLVARDRSQVDQIAEMYILSRLASFTVITWRRPIEDPIREWGQLLAYLPEVKKLLKGSRPRVILLPDPTLQARNIHDPLATLGQEAADRGISMEEVRRQARDEILEWAEFSGQSVRYLQSLLGD